MDDRFWPKPDIQNRQFPALRLTALKKLPFSLVE